MDVGVDAEGSEGVGGWGCLFLKFAEMADISVKVSDFG